MPRQRPARPETVGAFRRRQAYGGHESPSPMHGRRFRDFEGTLWSVLKEMRRPIRAGFLATKERKEHKDHSFKLFFLVIHAFFCGYTSG